MNPNIILLVYFLLISAITLATYKLDKKRAILQKRRISEESLHLLSIFGGSLAALYAQHKYRHKNKKLSFQIVFWLILVLQIAVVFFIVWAKSKS